MGEFATTDLCDEHEALLASGELVVLAPGLRHFGAITRFSGPARTLSVFEDNSLVRSALEGPGASQVLVVDGGASLRCALVGGKLAELGAANGWSGIIVHGAVRDAAELERAQIGVCALALNPRRSAKRGAGVAGLALRFGGAQIAPGDWIYADRDGVIVAKRVLAA